MPEQKPLERAALSDVPGLKPTKAERVLGYGNPPDTVFGVADWGDDRTVATVGGRSCRVPRDADLTPGKIALGSRAARYPAARLEIAGGGA